MVSIVYYTSHADGWISLPAHCTPPQSPVTREQVVMYGDRWQTFAQMVTASGHAQFIFVGV